MGEPPMVFALCCLRANLFRTHHPSTLYVPTVLRSRRILRSSSWIQNKKPAGNYKSCNLSATCLQAGDHYLGGPWNFVNDIAMIINGCFGPVTILSKLLENGYLVFFTCMKLHSGPDSYPDNPRRAPLWSCTKPLRSSSGTSCIRRTFDPGTWERLSKSQGYLGHIVKVTRARGGGHWSPERELAGVPLDRLARWGGVRRRSYNLLKARCSYNLVLLKARCLYIQMLLKARCSHNKVLLEVRCSYKEVLLLVAKAESDKEGGQERGGPAHLGSYMGRKIWSRSWPQTFDFLVFGTFSKRCLLVLDWLWLTTAWVKVGLVTGWAKGGGGRGWRADEEKLSRGRSLSAHVHKWTLAGVADGYLMTG